MKTTTARAIIMHDHNGFVNELLLLVAERAVLYSVSEPNEIVNGEGQET